MGLSKKEARVRAALIRAKKWKQKEKQDTRSNVEHKISKGPKSSGDRNPLALFIPRKGPET